MDHQSRVDFHRTSSRENDELAQRPKALQQVRDELLVGCCEENGRSTAQLLQLLARTALGCVDILVCPELLGKLPLCITGGDGNGAELEILEEVSQIGRRQRLHVQ